jgi:hypothetical protein
MNFVVREGIYHWWAEYTIEALENYYPALNEYYIWLKYFKC